MQVMNGKEFEQTSVLIGQAGQTKGFGVSADPMLMSMLSTGLYAYPLRTMLQEIMFNAWDAHRMGNCQDRPIDVYLDDTSGLIVRDYGPGISPNDMHDVYCIYGNSTKRDDKGQTGGFGLGSKSPFAYTDSFTVNSQHEGKKYMYVVNRVSDENDGGPGMTPIIQGVPTSESGLTVTVPLKEGNDMNRAYRYIKDILYLSGIKCNLHYSEGDSEEPMELIEAESVAPFEYVNDTESTGIYAVYGGVKYIIEDEDTYTKEYEFLKTLSRTIGRFYIGFPPDSLTPLPNREGLNLSEKSVESIKSQLETMMEQFMLVCKPATRAAMDFTMDILAETGIQPHFLAYRWTQIGREKMSNILENGEKLQHIKTNLPDGIGESLWNSMVRMAYFHTYAIASLIGHRNFNTMRGIVFVKKFPKWKKFLNFLTDDPIQMSRLNVNMSEHLFPEFVQNTNKALDAVRKATNQDIELRMQFGSTSAWTVVSGYRGGKKPPRHLSPRKIETIKKQQALGLHKAPVKAVFDRLWSHKDGNEVKTLMLENHIIVAKTVTSLNETHFNLMRYFAPNHKFDSDTVSTWHKYHSTHFQWRDNIANVPAIVVHKKKDGYDTAISVLKGMGFKVIEADEPKPAYRKPPELLAGVTEGTVTPTRRGPPTFPVVDPHRNDWVDYDADEITNPQCYFCCTLTRIHGYYSYDKPYTSTLRHVLARFPRTVILHNKQRESILTKKNVPVMAQKIDEVVDKLLADKDRIRQMFLHEEVADRSHLPKEIMAIPEMQKLMGLPYLRTKQAEKFRSDWLFLNDISRDRSEYVWSDTRKKIDKAFEEYENDPSLSAVLKMCDKTKFFDEAELRHKVGGMKPGQRKMLAQKIARFLRTV